MDDVAGTGRGMKDAFKIDDAQVRGHVDRIVVESVEQTLNGLLEAEAKQLCGAGKYERTDARKDTRAGSYARKLQRKTIYSDNFNILILLVYSTMIAWRSSGLL